MPLMFNGCTSLIQSCGKAGSDAKTVFRPPGLSEAPAQLPSRQLSCRGSINSSAAPPPLGACGHGAELSNCTSATGKFVPGGINASVTTPLVASGPGKTSNGGLVAP